MVHLQLRETQDKRLLCEALQEEPFTLVLSAGFFGFYAHVGFLQALEELELRPQAVIGVSAGDWAKKKDADQKGGILVLRLALDALGDYFGMPR